MTAYLSRMNRKARRNRIAEAAFEWFISHLEGINDFLISSIVVSVWSVMVWIVLVGWGNL